MYKLSNVKLIFNKQKYNIKNKDNPLAMKVLSEGAIDLKDKRINLETINIADSLVLESDT